MTSVPEGLRNQVTQNNSSLNSLDDELYSFEFDPVVFTHAWQLLGNSPTRYGNDLSPYLVSTHDFFSHRDRNGLLALTFGTPDFKRRISEDLGASIASLFMVNSFGLKWNTIAQIPENHNLSKTRPDFEGFNETGERYLYEAKGRSNINNVISAIDILDTFPVLKKKEEKAFGEFMSKHKCLEEYDRIGRVMNAE